MFGEALFGWKLDGIWLERAKELSHDKSLVTFDIFDTALTRDVEQPVDVFAKVEQALEQKNMGAEGFATARQKAEQKARQMAWAAHGFTEINFDEIYAQLPAFIDVTPQHAKAAQALEVKIEQESLFPVPDIVALTHYLSQNAIPFAFVSDMYLGKAVLQDFLAQAGYQGWQDIVVSCDWRKTKADGSIWNIATLLKKHILHIGDNEHSDVAMVRPHPHITPLPYTRARSVARAVSASIPCPSPHILPFSKQNRLMEIARRADPHYATVTDKDRQHLYALGASAGALLIGAFTLWLRERARKNNITHITFCARDGFLLRKAWKILGDDRISDSYLHVSRKVLILSSAFLSARNDYLPPDLLEFLSDYHHPLTVRQIFENIDPDGKSGLLIKAISHFGSIDKIIKGRWKRRKLQQFLQQHSAAVYDLLQQHYENIRAYFIQQGILEHKKPAMVDLGWHGRLQSHLSRICRSIKTDFQITGFYYGLWRQALSERWVASMMEAAFFNEFDAPGERFFQCQGIDIIENLHSSAEGTTTAYQQQGDERIPLNSPTGTESRQHEMLIAPFQQGALDALQAIKDTGSHKSLSIQDLTIENAWAAYYALFASPTGDEVSVLGKIAHGVSFDHTLAPILKQVLPKNKRHCRRMMRGCVWQVGQLKYWFAHASDKQRRFIRDFAKKRFPHISPQHLHILEKN